MDVDALRQWILENTRALPPEWAVVIVAALPVLELRGAVPLGFALGLAPLPTLILALAGNLAPVPLLLWLLRPLTARLRRTRLLRVALEWLHRRTEAKSVTVRRYGWWGLVLLVAVPLPTTGAWTGAMVASLLAFSFRPPLTAIALGTAAAGVIVIALTMFGWSLAVPRPL